MGASKHEARTSLLSGSPSDLSYQQSNATSIYEPYVGGYHYREGLQPAIPNKSKSRSLCLLLPNSRWTWAFFGISFVQAVASLAMEAWIFARFQLSLDSDTNAIQTTVTTYLSLFIFGFFYQLILVMDALRLKNTIQIIGLCLYNVGLLIEAAVQRDQISDAIHLVKNDQAAEHLQTDFSDKVNAFIIALPCVLGVGTVLLSLVAFKLYEEFTWSIYKHISADLRLKRRYLSYQIYITLLKFDFFFFLAFTVQFLVVVISSNHSDIEFPLTIAAIPVTIIILFLAAFWTRKESVFGMLIIIVVYFGAMAYFIFKLVRMYAGSPELQAAYLPAKRSLTTFAVITLLLLLVTIAYAVICTLNFNKGLKPHLGSGSRRQVRQASQDLDKLYTHDGVPLAHAGHTRMTID